MNNVNVNGQNGVATSALKNAVIKAVKMIGKAEYTKVGYVKINEGLRLSFDGTRFIREGKDNFIFNGKIEKKCENGRYDQVMVEIHYKNLDNEKGLYLDSMVNAVLDAVLNNIDNWIIAYYKSESSSKWVDGLEMYQNMRNEFFGSRLVVDNMDNTSEIVVSEDLNSPDALDNDEDYGFIGLEDASEVCDNHMMACVDKYGQEFIDRVLNEYADVVYNAVSDYDLNDTIKYCVKGALDYMEYDPKKKRLVGCSVVPDLESWVDEEEFCNYFEDAYGFDEDSCMEFYEEYCDDIWHFADEYDNRMEDALRDFDEESVFDKMFYKVYYDNEDGYINVYIDMDDFVDYIKKNMVFNDSKAQLFKKKDLGMRLYYVLDPDNEDIEQFYKDLKDMLPMVTDVKLYDDGLYVYHMTYSEYFKERPISPDLKNITISEYYKLSKNFVDGCFNYYIKESQSCSSCGGATHYYYDVAYYINGSAIVKSYREDVLMAEIIEDFREYIPKEIKSLISYELGI